MFVQYSFIQDQGRQRPGAPATEFTPGMVVGLGIVAMLVTTIGYMLA